VIVCVFVGMAIEGNRLIEEVSVGRVYSSE